MPRTKIEAQALMGANNAPAGLNVVYTACDEVNGNRVRLTGGEVLSVMGTGTLEIASVPDALGRVSNIEVTLDGTEDQMLFGPFAVPGWGQSDGFLYFDGEDTLDVAWLSAAR